MCHTYVTNLTKNHCKLLLYGYIQIKQRVWLFKANSLIKPKWDYSSAGEHFVDIEGVTGSIPVSPTISTKIKYVRNNKDLACKLLKLLSYFFYQSPKRTYLIPNTFLKNRSKIDVFSPKIVCKSLLDFFQQSQNKFSVTGQVSKIVFFNGFI